MKSTHLKLTSYFAARQRTGQQYLADAMLDNVALKDLLGKKW